MMEVFEVTRNQIRLRDKFLIRSRQWFEGIGGVPYLESFDAEIGFEVRLDVQVLDQLLPDAGLVLGAKAERGPLSVQIISISSPSAPPSKGTHE